MAFNLPTLAEMQTRRRAVSKSELPTRMDKADAKKKATALDVRKLVEWAKQVKDRDGWKDRYTGRRVKGTRMVLHPDAAHAHHVAPRENTDVRYDTRNGITLSAKTHDRVERNQLLIVGTVWFTVNGKRYINCDYPVKFMETER